MRATGRSPVISAITLTELYGGIAIDRVDAITRATALATFLRFVPVLPYTDAEARAYGAILQKAGHARGRVLDRMIAAQAIVAELTLITINGSDFRDIPGLDLEIWPAPDA